MSLDSVCESSELSGDSWISKFQSSQDGVNAIIVPSSGFSGAASFTMLKLRVKE